MNLVKNLFTLLKKAVKGIVSSRLKLAIFLIIVALAIFLGWKFFSGRGQTVQYQTSKVEKGTLISSVSASGSIISGNSIPITSQATGIVKEAYVNNGDQLSVGQTIAELTLDQDSQQKQVAAWSQLLSAKNQLASAQSNLYNLQNQEFVANQKFINDAVARGLATDDPTYIEENATWLAAEANYKNQQNVIIQAQANLSSVQLSYQQYSPTITSPATGKIINSVLSKGYLIQSQTNSTNSSSNTSSSVTQNLGAVQIEGPLQATVNLSELDITKVKTDQKVTLTLDAFPDKTFTGKVTTINTTGTVSSGVTNYPVTISLDNSSENIYPNMAVSSNIIIDVKDNVLIAPSSAVQTQGTETIVRVLKNGQVSQVSVTTGNSSDTQTEITSGLSEGDEVITSTLNSSSTQRSGTTQSPFSGQLRIGGGAGGFGGR